MAARRSLLLDTDGGSDDVVALIMAMRNRDVHIVGVTTVAGNVGVKQATRNVLLTIERCDADAPVYEGAAKPLRRAHEDATWYHGRDGVSDRRYAPPQRQAESRPAVEAITEALERNPGLELVALGPLTNIALALTRNPEAFVGLGRCIVMGGAPCCEGNVTPAAEYNFWADPDAARAVLRSGIPVELVGWQLSRDESALSASDIDTILKMSTGVARFAMECTARARHVHFEQHGRQGLLLPDPVAMSIALDPAIGVSWSEHFVDVETDSALTRGMSVVDRLNVADSSRNRDIWAPLLERGRKARVYWAIDTNRWKQSLTAALS
jgi:inosine-uridine nucleoside N-ribohydrolase